MIRVDEVADGIYRLSTMDPGFSITVNQFLIDDKRPTLIHTGMFPMYEDVRRAVAEVLDPARLAYAVCPHFEADECGGMGRFVAEAPEAVLAHNICVLVQAIHELGIEPVFFAPAFSDALKSPSSGSSLAQP
jgi:flavorubredoxin